MHTKSLPLNQDLTIREFLSEKDAALVKFMDNASIIKAQRDALEALNSAALAQALRASEQTAAKEDKERAREKELPVKVHISDVSPKMSLACSEPPSSMSLSPLNADVLERYSDDEAAARLLARDWGVASLQGALLQNPDIASAQHQLPVSSSVLPSSIDSSTTSTSSLSSSASAAARKTTASASFAPTRVIPVTIPAEAFYSRSHRRRRGDSDSSSSSASSSNTVFISSRPSTATTSPGPSSQKSSSPPTPTAVPTSPTKDWSNSSRPYTSASSVAAAHAQAQAQAATKFTSASKSIYDNVMARGSSTIPISTAMTNNSAIGVQGTSKRVYPETVRRRSISSSSERLHTAPSPVAKAHTSMLDALTIDIKNNASSTSATAALVTPTTSSYSSASSRSSSVTSSPGISPSTSATSATSVSASSSHSVASASPVTVTSASKVAAEKEREREKERNKSRIAATITSKSAMTPSSSASAAAKRVNTSRPTPISVNTSGVSGDHSRKRSDAEQCGRNEVLGSGSQALSPTYVSAVTLPSQTPRTTRGPEPISISSSAFSSHQKRTSISTIASTLASSCASAVVGKSTDASSSAASTPPRPLSPHTVRPRDAEELFSIPPTVLGGARAGGLGAVGSTNVLGGWYQQQQVRGGVVGGLKAIVPVSWLSESDDEDDSAEEKDQKEKDTRNEKETEEDNKNEKEAEEDNKNEKEEEEDSSDEEEEQPGEELKQGFDVLGEENVSFLGVYTAVCSCSKCGESIVYSPHNPVCSPLFSWRSHMLIRFCVSCLFPEKICFVVYTSRHLSALLDSLLPWMCFSDDQVPEKLYRSREQYTLQHHQRLLFASPGDCSF